MRRSAKRGWLARLLAAWKRKRRAQRLKRWRNEIPGLVRAGRPPWARPKVPKPVKRLTRAERKTVNPRSRGFDPAALESELLASAAAENPWLLWYRLPSTRDKIHKAELQRLVKAPGWHVYYWDRGERRGTYLGVFRTRPRAVEFLRRYAAKYPDEESSMRVQKGGARLTGAWFGR